METKKIKLRFGILSGMILLAAFSRMIPHMPNFTPMAAIGLFGAAYLSKKWQAFLIPIAATLLSDLFINTVVYRNFYSSFTLINNGFLWQYGSYFLIILTGFFIFNKVTTTRVITGALSSAVIFYIISNFGSFIISPVYPSNLNGLISCYIAGIPFIGGTILGNLFYSGVLFGSFAFLEQRFPVLRSAIRV
jgi:hypothetical protein